MAHKKGVGSSRNGRDSNPKYRGVKKYGGERVRAGESLVLFPEGGRSYGHRTQEFARGAFLPSVAVSMNYGRVLFPLSATDLGGRFLAPGFIDMHIHGAMRRDAMRNHPWREWAGAAADETIDPRPVAEIIRIVVTELVAYRRTAQDAKEPMVASSTNTSE